MAEQNEIEDKLSHAIAEIERAAGGGGANARWLMVRALLHRAVHYATEKPGVEYCALATYLAEMIGHAHKLAHGDNPRAHQDVVH